MISKRNWFEPVATGILVVCAIVLTVTTVARQFSKPPDPRKPTKVKDWRSYSDGEIVVGPAAAPVTITVYSDFQCPFCKAFASRLDTLLAGAPDSIRLVFRNFPIKGLHPQALPAAIAGLCSHRQGRFLAMHDALFSAQDSLGSANWEELAQSVGVRDSAGFRRCLEDSTVLASIAADSISAKRLGVTGTPTVLVNNLQFRGAPEMDRLRAAVKDADRRE